ncbi:MAG TPA: tripartite tricarboxylate transporter substrate binding protein [Burkholderiales bacterium]|nr:tripartite tricarboxylate transporter substrate binding protein [Burkholderiales bacterium]
MLERIKRSTLSRILFAVIGWCAICAPYAGVAKAAAYPERPIRIIVPFGAGGANDVVIRILATRLTDTLGQQIVVDNRTGAGGLIGTEIAAKSTPDGYTLLGTATPHVIFPHLHKKMPYDPLKDFAPVMQIGGQPYVVTIHPSLGVSNLKELIALAQKNPGKINYGSSGNGGAQHMFFALFAHMAKIDMVHVPYKSSALARADLLGGQVKIGCLGVASVINNHKAGQLRIIAVTSAKRSPELPDIPAIAETVPGYDASLWTVLLAPRGTPQTVIDRLSTDITKLLQTKDMKDAFEKVGTYVVIKNSREAASFIATEYKKWGDVARAINLKIN